MSTTVKEITPDVENPTVEILEKIRKVMSAPNWITKIKKIFDDVLKRKIFDVHQDQGPYLQMWNSIFVISCVFAVSLDPLFFYVVSVDQDEKCLHTDKKLKIVALVMRSFTDVIFLVHLICEILDSVQKTMDKKSRTTASKMNTTKNEPFEALKQTRGNSGKKWEARELIQYARKIAQNKSSLSIIIDVLALLPLPQLIILIFYPKEGSGFVEHKMFVNVFLLGQYVPRVFRIHLSAKVFKRMNGIWAKGLFNLFLYILAGHAFMQMEATKTEDVRRQGKTEERKPEEAATKTEDVRRQGKTEVRKPEEAIRHEGMRQQGIKTEERKIEEAIRDEEMRQKAAKKDAERCLCMKTLTKIPMLKEMDEKVLTMMCDYLKPATYIENSFVFRTGDPLDCMLLIMEGTMWTYASSDSHAGQGISSMAIKPLRKGDFYGEELLDWASDCFTEVPVSSKHVKSRTKVEAFVLMAEDLETVASQFRPPEEVEKVTFSAVLRFHTKAQRRPPPSLAEIGDDNSETLPSAASN